MIGSTVGRGWLAGATADRAALAARIDSGSTMQALPVGTAEAARETEPDPTDAALATAFE